MRRSSRLKVSKPIYNDADDDISSLSSSLGSDEVEVDLPLPDPRTNIASENDNPFNYEFDIDKEMDEDANDSPDATLADEDSSFKGKGVKKTNKETQKRGKRKTVGRDPLLTINEHVDEQHARKVQKKQNYRSIEKLKIREFTEEEKQKLQRIREAYAEIDKYELVVEKIEEEE